MHYAYTLRLYQGNEKAFGPGIASLLELVDRGGSLREAAASMKMAYSKAWQIIRNAEASLGFALLLSKAGGRSGGGAQVTPQGRELLERYRRFEADLREQANTLFEEYFGK